MNHNAVIEIKNFSLQLGGFRLQGINLDIRKGEIFAILGKTGAGKTVLLESIAGFYRSKTGSIRVKGKNITEVPLEKRQIGFVYQDFGLFPHMTAFGNIGYGLKMKRIPKENRRTMILETAELLSISHILEQYPGTLSGGERQRTALARALVLKPEILLMDEPFSSLDPVTKQSMYQQVLQIHDIFGCTILFVTHDFTEAQTIADRIGIMSGGILKTVRNRGDLFQRSSDIELNAFLGIKEEEIMLKNIKLDVDGIMCMNCVNKINTALSGLEGCESSAVSKDFKTVSVRYDEDRLTADLIAGCIENIKEKSFHVSKLEEGIIE